MKNKLLFILVGILLSVGAIMGYSKLRVTSSFSPFPLQENSAEYSFVKAQNSYSLTYRR